MVGLRAKQKAQRETRILDSALSVFRARGFDAARMEQIAQMAELSTGTLYNYFPTKGDLLVAIVGLETADTLVAGQAILDDPPGDPTGAVLALARAWYDHSFRLLDRKLWRHAFAMMIERPGSPSSLRFAQNDTRLQQQAAALISILQRRGHACPSIDATDAGLCVFNLIDRTFMTYIADDEMSFDALMHLLGRQMAILGLDAPLLPHDDPGMTYAEDPLEDPRDMIALFQTTFAASEGAAEGRMIADLVTEIFASPAPGDVFAFTARTDDTLTGCIVFTRLRYPRDDKTVFLMSPVAVATQAQGQGIGQGLIRFGLAAMRAHGADVALTYGDPSFYSKVGFGQITTDQAQPPLPLSQPQGWLAQSLTDVPFEALSGQGKCVAAFNVPELW